jgi:hypothetical protein
MFGIRRALVYLLVVIGLKIWDYKLARASAHYNANVARNTDNDPTWSQ